MRSLPLLLLLGCPVSTPTDTGSGGDTGGHDTDTGSTDTGDTGGGGDLPPGAPEVAINPSTPGDASTLRAVIVTEAADPDGDAVTYRYEWLADGVVVAGETNDFVVSDLTSDGQVWTLNVYATDGTLEGPAGTASATVAELPPVAPTIHIDPSAPASGDDLTLVFDTPASDPNGDTLDQTIEWYENGTHNTSWDNRTTIDGMYVDGGDTFRAVVTVTDNHSEPLTVEASVTVPNTAPEITSVTISPTDPADGDDLTCAARAKDADGGSLATAYTWYRDGVAATDVGDTNTVAAAVTVVGEQWECEVTVSDGIDTATMMSSPVEIRAPSGYRVTARYDVTVTTDSSTGEASGTGTSEFSIYTADSSGVTNQCDIYWSLVAATDKRFCRGCTYSFDTDYTYDAASSSTTTGCSNMATDSGGSITFESRSTSLDGVIDDAYYSRTSYGYTYSSGPMELNESGSGGYSYSYAGYTFGQSYSVTSGVDAAGNVTLTAYSTEYRYY
jgi:hypothetical protein